MEGTIRIVSWFCKLLDLVSDLKIMLLLLLGGAYLGGLVQVSATFKVICCQDPKLWRVNLIHLLFWN